MKLDRHLSPEHLALAGALSLPAFLLGNALAAKAGLTILYITLFILSGRRFRLLPNLMVAAGIILANLISPFGRVLLRIGGFPITLGALRLGTMKAVTIIGLIYLSRLSIRAAIRLPGRIGEILSLTLFYFERILALQPRLDRKAPWTGLDRLLQEVYQTPIPGSAEGSPSEEGSAATTDLPGAVSGVAFVLLHWILYLVLRNN